MHARDNVRQTRELTYVTGHANTRSHLWKLATWRFICRGLPVNCILWHLQVSRLSLLWGVLSLWSISSLTLGLLPWPLSFSWPFWASTSSPDSTTPHFSWTSRNGLNWLPLYYAKQFSSFPLILPQLDQPLGLTFVIWGPFKVFSQTEDQSSPGTNYVFLKGQEPQSQVSARPLWVSLQIYIWI